MISLLALMFLASPGWITSCAYSHSLNDDPIVFPGQPGAAHLHDFVGAKGTDAFSTAQDLVQGATTCAMPDDRSAYWAPRLYIHGGSLSLTPRAAGQKNALFYYRRKGIGSTGVVKPFPLGLKLIVGNSHATSLAGNECLASGNCIFKCGLGSSTDLDHPPTQCPDGNLSVSLTFPNCWDGVHLDTADHKSHMKYPVNNKCPSTHPVVLPRIESFWRYIVGTAPLGEVGFAEDGGGVAPFYTVHQDFFDAWTVAGLQHFVDKCINGLLDCGKNPLP